MVEFVLENWASIIMGGAIVALWTVVRDRRLGLERYIDAHEKSDACQCLAYSRHNLRYPKRDAIDRVIARSVKRVMKEN